MAPRVCPEMLYIAAEGLTSPCIASKSGCNVPNPRKGGAQYGRNHRITRLNAVRERFLCRHHPATAGAEAEVEAMMTVEVGADSAAGLEIEAAVWAIAEETAEEATATVAGLEIEEVAVMEIAEETREDMEIAVETREDTEIAVEEEVSRTGGIETAAAAAAAAVAAGLVIVGAAAAAAAADTEAGKVRAAILSKS